MKIKYMRNHQGSNEVFEYPHVDDIEEAVEPLKMVRVVKLKCEI